jgi:hypothetical protein
VDPVYTKTAAGGRAPGAAALFAAMALILLAVPAPARDRADTLACIAAMQTEADWAACRSMMFAGCADRAAGSQGHLACLRDDRDGWRAALDTARDDVMRVITLQGGTELGQLMGQWFGYVGQKCAAVGEARAAISREAAELGCEISETVGLISELHACTAGASTAPYCIRMGD